MHINQILVHTFSHGTLDVRDILDKNDLLMIMRQELIEKRDHLATNIIFELCIPSERGHCELENDH